MRATVIEHLRNGKVIAVTASGSKHVKRKTVTLAGTSASLAPGTTKTLTLTLNSVGRSLLARYGKLSVLVTVSAGANTLERLTVHLVEPPQPKKK